MVSVRASFCSRWEALATEKFGATTARKLVSTAIGHLSAVAATKGTFEPAVVAVVLRAAQSIVECGCDIGFLDRCVCEATAPRLAAPCFLAVFLPSTGSDPPPLPPPLVLSASFAGVFMTRRIHPSWARGWTARAAVRRTSPSRAWLMQLWVTPTS
jgi:hypothetical protein